MGTHGFLCSSKIYEYEGVTFEMHSRMGPCPLKKNGDPKVYADRAFYALYDRFAALSDKERETYRVGGGCIQF